MEQLSTGQDSTLGVWQQLCKQYFRPDHPCHAFLAGRIAQAPRGVNEEVLADELQFLWFLADMGETI